MSEPIAWIGTSWKMNKTLAEAKGELEKALEAGRRAAAKATLQRVAKTKPLSNDVFEIVSKMLE